ncbi:MAG: ABC transporter substrate-binding protein [Bdellovibrionota bacterium]
MKSSRLGMGLLAALALAWGCQKKEAGEIRIGEYGSLTGNTATFGQSTHKGVLLAVEEANAAGGVLGKKITLITEDDQSKPEEARTAALKLIRQDKVIALIGEVASSRSLAAAPEAQRAKIPMISSASTNPQVTQVGDFIFRACFIDPFQGGTMARFAFEDLKVRRVAMLVDIKNDYSVGLSQFFEKTFKELGGEIIASESYSEGDIEFRAQLTKIRESKPEAIFVPGYYTEAGLIAKQARELGLAIPLLGGDGWDSTVTLEIGKEAVEGVYFSNHYASDDPSPRIQEFIAKFKKRWEGEVPDAMAVLGYDAANMLLDAIRRAGEPDPIKIRDQLAATKEFAGVTGDMMIDADRNARKPIVILKIEGGKFKFVKSLAPQ